MSIVVSYEKQHHDDHILARTGSIGLLRLTQAACQVALKKDTLTTRDRYT